MRHAALLASLLAVAICPRLAFGQCSWSSKVVLSWTTSDQPGITSFTAGGVNKLFVTFVGTDSNRTVNVGQSTNGTTFTNLVVLTSMRSSRGVAISGSPATACNSLYLAFPGRDGSATMNVAKSSNGISWTGPNQPFTIVRSTPAMDTSLTTIGIGYSTDHTLGQVAAERTFNCNVGSVSAQDTDYWWTTNCSSVPPGISCPTYSNGSPAMAGAVVSSHWQGIKAVAQPNIDLYARLIAYARDLGNPTSLGGNWSSAGITGAMNPSTGIGYLAWRGGDGKINLANENAGQRICSDTSPSTPTIGFFQGKLYVIWRGGDNKLNVASLTPF
jgi:hypothetical protein